MKIIITGHHVRITDALKLHIKNKLKKLNKHFDNIININVILIVEKERMKAEATLKIKHINLYADDEKEDMYAAIDGLVEKLDRQLKKEKEKIKSYR